MVCEFSHLAIQLSLTSIEAYSPLEISQSHLSKK